MLQPSFKYENARRGWMPIIGIVVATFMLVTWSSNDPAHATVIEYDDDGTPVITNLVKPDVTDVEVSSPTSTDNQLQPRQLSKLSIEQLLFRKLASDTALRYAGSDGVKAAGLDALTFVDVFTTLIHRESNYDPKTVSSKGAKGLGQLRDETAADLNVTDPFDARQNLHGSARYLTQMLKRFGSLELALAAYNAGPARVEEYNGVPPFRETKQYVVDIFHNVGLETDLVSQSRKPNQTAIIAPRENPKSQPDTNDQEKEKSVWEF